MPSDSIVAALLRICFQLVGTEVTREILDEEEADWANEIADKYENEKFRD